MTSEDKAANSCGYTGVVVKVSQPAEVCLALSGCHQFTEFILFVRTGHSDAQYLLSYNSHS